MYLWWRLLPHRDEEGASAVEYGLMVFAIAAVIAVVVFVLGDVVVELFDDTCDGIASGANGGACA